MARETYEIEYGGERYTEQAVDEEQAAERFASTWFFEGDSQCPDDIVRVRRKGDEEWSCFRVEMAMVPEFTAREADDE